jgi:hypothetical protein
VAVLNERVGGLRPGREPVTPRPDVRRTVTENACTLAVDTHEFESE